MNAPKTIMPNWEFKNELGNRLRYGIFLILVTSIYFLLNRTISPKFDFSIALDSYIPFIPFFSFFYITYFVFLAGWVAYAFLKFPVQKFQSLVLSLVILHTIAYIFYIALPGEVVRPDLKANGFFEQIVKLIYQSDKTVNVLPSLHVAVTLLVALFVWSHYPKIVLPWALTIIISTVLIRQHYILDVASGLVLSPLVYIYYRPKN